MQLSLAPMDGVLDPLMRDLLTQINDYDLCVTEFVRVVDSLLPQRTFYRLAPELHNDGKTLAGCPVRVQLLGQHPQWLAENAARAIELGSPGVDLNCGCPAKQVNKSEGGAVLLKKPELIYQIVSQMRKAVPIGQTLSVKIRLGWDDPNQCFEVAQAVEAGGADELAIHARTKEDGYRANTITWPKIDEVRQQLSIPVIANGEIVSADAATRCMQQTQTQRLMLGRGALQLPNLANVIRGHQQPYTWSQVIELIMVYTAMETSGDKAKYFANRIKQWFAYLRVQYPQARELFAELRLLKQTQAIKDLLQRSTEIA
ncbi:tRNA dihydrouridine(16) synthase DusC [Alginatibacterium sediminis]|uniref:tRNA-dihydrouridine(16) synthase n=1 Tax=Alginatibacterium sediminis TaxID=2164068 RepID=A0A420EI72_9ALTE|nr:tRNA dihydrouridine(16) synthase DusC [Alginatibacterium sediminis]RKF20256.1 tRNA dihydrouridine(16) synthase DusC [Alginatibacterium sediminis]